MRAKRLALALSVFLAPPAHWALGLSHVRVGTFADLARLAVEQPITVSPVALEGQATDPPSSGAEMPERTDGVHCGQ